MVTATNILYSVAAARRILGIYYPEIKVSIQVWAKVVLVISDGRRPRFISKKVFHQHFVDWRKEQAKALVVQRHELLTRSFNVVNPKKDSTYRVVACKDALHCECEDYKNQIGFWGKAMCKHSFATLDFIGYRSFADYLAAQQVAAA